MTIQIRPNQVQPGDEADAFQTVGGVAVWAPLPAPVASLDDLTDVDLAGQADGDFLQRVAGVWVPVDAPGATTAGELTTRYQPMVIVTAGTPELLYDSGNNLMMVEVPNP